MELSGIDYPSKQVQRVCQNIRAQAVDIIRYSVAALRFVAVCRLLSSDTATVWYQGLRVRFADLCRHLTTFAVILADPWSHWYQTVVNLVRQIPPLRGVTWQTPSVVCPVRFG